MAVTNVTFELGPNVTIVGPDNTVLLSPISGASVNVVPQPAGTAASGSIAIDSNASLNFTFNIPAGTPGGKGDDGNDGVGVSTITATQGDVVSGESSTVTFDFGMSDHSTKQITATIPAGAQGNTGDDGISAYQVAVKNGYTGTETAWLASLVGATGESAYQAAVDGGFVGTQADWIASLKGEKGDPGPIGPIADTTDWTTQIPINARSAQAHFAVLSGTNTFSGVNTFTKQTTIRGVGYSDGTMSNSISLEISNPLATNNTIYWGVEQITATGDNYALLGISSTDSSNNPVYRYMKFHFDGVIETPSGTVANCGAANTFTGNNTYSGPVTFSGITTVPTPTDYTQKQAIGASDADARYGRLSGGNTFYGSQVISSDNFGNPLLVQTSKGQGFEFGLNQDTSFIDFHSVTAGNGADYDSRILATGDITKGTARLDFETNNLTWGGNPLALQNQLPFSDTGLKMQTWTQVTGTRPYGIKGFNYPIAFRAGTIPTVFVMTTREAQGGNSCIAMVQPNGSTPIIDNTGFQLYTTTGTGDSTVSQQFWFLAIGYF